MNRSELIANHHVYATFVTIEAGGRVAIDYIRLVGLDACPIGTVLWCCAEAPSSCASRGAVQVKFETSIFFADDQIHLTVAVHIE